MRVSPLSLVTYDCYRDELPSAQQIRTGKVPTMKMVCVHCGELEEVELASGLLSSIFTATNIEKGRAVLRTCRNGAPRTADATVWMELLASLNSHDLLDLYLVLSNLHASGHVPAIFLEQILRKVVSKQDLKPPDDFGKFGA